ncbi:MAG: hypothetical protein DHS20C21_21650 [Gemmatimonadota bacterium]|nr:MAG: hypothetical protein DHS20C21_21650 [Gemmatimonadota bacterium]
MRWGPELSFTAWGVLLLVGGVATWSSIARKPTPVPTVWNPTVAAANATSQMTSALRHVSSGAPTLLRLEWPEHPGATEYRIYFRGADGRRPPTLSVRSSVFLYDLESNVLRLPARFEWEVAAVLEDGSEVVSPWRTYPDR